MNNLQRFSLCIRVEEVSGQRVRQSMTSLGCGRFFDPFPGSFCRPKHYLLTFPYKAIQNPRRRIAVQIYSISHFLNFI